MKKDRNSYLINNTIIFAIGNFSTKLITFLLVPIYTSVLSTSDFGKVDLLYTICSFLIPIFSLNINEAVLRFSLDKKENNKIISIAFLCIILMIVLGLGIIPILQFFPDFKNFSILMYFYLITFGISQILLTNLKGQEKLKLFSIGNFLYALLVAVLNIIILIILDLGVYGYFIAYILANIITIIYCVIAGNVINSFKNFQFDYNLFKLMIKYSIILIPTSFLWWIMNFLDRVMISNYINYAANGIYTISYKIPTILTVISSIFTQAWLFTAIKDKDSQDNAEYTNKIFEILSFVVIIITLVLLLFLKPILSIYVADEYYIAWKYVPFLMVGYIFMTLSTFVSTSYNVNIDSKGFLFSALTGAICNLILNVIMIPNLGIYGAASATAISYFVVFVYRIIDTKKYLKINIDIKFILSIILIIIFSCCIYFNNLLYNIIQILIIIFIIILYKKAIIQIINILIYKVKRKK